MIPLNLLAVSIATVVAFVLGFLFHGPVSGKLPVIGTQLRNPLRFIP